MHYLLLWWQLHHKLFLNPGGFGPLFQDKTMEHLLKIIEDNRDQFSNEFIEWLPKNEHVWRAFVKETNKVISVGFKHYSARTIIHVLRHHSALVENGTPWKISNNSSPYLARLFALAYPDFAGIFHYKATPKADRDNWVLKNNRRLF